MSAQARQGSQTVVLVIDDEAAIREVLAARLRGWGYRVAVAADADSARRALADVDPDLVISDVRLPGITGLEMLDLLRDEGSLRPCVLITAYGTVDVAVEAMKRGARDFLTKPLDYRRLREILDGLEREVEFRRATRSMAPGWDRKDGLGALVGVSPPMRALFQLIQTAAPTQTSVMITGESGTGKEVVARMLHAMGSRPDGPFIALNAAALPEGLIEAELFGHEKGSFTGAVASRPGCFELAHGGMLFLDELAEMPLRLQPKLLRVLEDGRLRPLGSSAEQLVDVRVVAATNRDPEQAIADGTLRADLYYRLNVFHLRLPPLRERREDIPLLATRFVEQANQKHGATVDGVDPAALELLQGYDWPGNVRELRNVIERGVIVAQQGALGATHLPPELTPKAGSSPRTDGALVLPPEVTAAEAERILILDTLKQVNNNKAAAARRLGIDVKTIRNKLKAYNLGSDGG